GPRTRGEIYAEAASSLGVVPSKGNAPAVLMPDRIGVASPGRPLLGAAVSPDRFGDADKAVLAESADFIQVPMRWVDMEPNEGSYDFAATDRWIEWAVRVAKLPVAAGPLVDFRANSTPEWLYIWENDYETLGELVREHVKALVTRYRRTVTRWTVVGGLQVNDNIRLGFEQMLDLSRVAVNIVRKLHPAARVLVEIDQPFGEYHTHNERSLPPMLFAEMLNQAGVNVDGYGLRVQLGGAASGQGTRDLLAFSDLLDRYAALERPISLTAVGCPSNIPPSLQAEKYAAVAPGCWRGEWTEAAQADWLTAALTIAASKPFIQAVCWQQVGDRTRRPEMPAGGLVGPEETPKAAANALRDIRDALKEGNVPSRIEDATVLSRTASG
ncbi:MAG: endo-1,4-beta-xylanase, partial [Planctomycetota bacterium]